MPNHQLNSTSNFTESFPEPGILVSIFGFHPQIAVWIRALEGESRRLSVPAAVHLPSPDPAFITGGIVDGLHRCNVGVWSGGWSGALAALLTREELEWEHRWGESNRDGTGLEQLFGRAGQVYFPTCATPGQVVHLAETVGRPVCGGYASPPVPGTRNELWLYRQKGWCTAPTLFLPLGGSSHPWMHFPGSLGGDRPPITHLTLNLTSIAPTDELPDPRELVDRLLNTGETTVGHTVATPHDDLPERGATYFSKPPASTVDTLPPFFAPILPNGTGTLLQLGPAAAAPLRRGAHLHHDRLAGTLTALSPFRSEKVPALTRFAGAVPDAPMPEEFQGSTEGHLMIREGTFTVRFASGRVAGLADEAIGSTVPRRATGFLREHSGTIPRISYLQTEHAAWFTGHRYRGVEERAILKLAGRGAGGGAPIELETTTILPEYTPGALMSYKLSFPATLPGTPCSLAMLQIPVCWCEREETCRLEIVDGDGIPRELTLPPGPGVWTVAAWLLRLPVPGGSGFWIGAAEPNGRQVITMRIERAPVEKRLLLTVEPVFHYEGILPHDLAGTEVAGTLILAPGTQAPEKLKINRSGGPAVRYFSRTVPE